MIRKILAMFSIGVLAFSCTLPDEDDELYESFLGGKWEMSEVQREESSTLNLPKEIAEKLLSENCELLTFTFTDDGKVNTTSKLNHITFNAGPNGLTVDCPEQTDTESTVWELDGDKLTFADSPVSTNTITIQLEGDTLTIDGADIDADNYSNMKIIFKRV